MANQQKSQDDFLMDCNHDPPQKVENHKAIFCPQQLSAWKWTFASPKEWCSKSGGALIYGTAQMQGKWGSRVARKSLVSHARVARKSRASCPHVTRESLSSHTQTTRVIINCTTIGLLYLYCYKPFVISITKEYYSVHFFLQPLPTNTRSPIIVINWS